MKPRGRIKYSGFCAGCGEMIPHTDRIYTPAYWNLDRDLEDWELDGMIIAVAVALGETREEAVQTVGSAAIREGKSFEESLSAYFWLYTDGRIPKVEGYRGRVACRGVQPEPLQPEPIPVRETLFETVPPIQTGRIQSRGRAS